MYLMALDNIDYIVITILFAVTLIIGYLFRRKNQTTVLFIYSDNNKLYTPNQFLIGYGIIELVLCGVIGSLYGVSGIYYIIFAILVNYLLSLFIVRVIYPYSLLEYVGLIFGAKAQAGFASFFIIVLLFLAITTTVFTFKLFQPLFGWNFVNSVFGVTGLTLIYVLIGGRSAIKFNLILSSIIVLLGFLFVIIAGVINLKGFSGIFANLHDLAKAKDVAYDFYTGFNINSKMLYQIIITGLFLTMASFLIESSHDRRYMGFLTLLKIIPIGLMVMSGIIAISTPIVKNNSGDMDVVTIQTQLPDGQTGYVVKAIRHDGKAKPLEATPGIIPPFFNPTTNLIEPNAYNYMLASVMTLKYYLPKYLSVILVLVILAAFMFGFAQYLHGISKLVVFDVYAKLNWLSEYGEDGRMWLARMSIIAASIISLFGGYFLVPYLDLVIVTYVAGATALIFCLFMLYIINYGQIQKK